MERLARELITVAFDTVAGGEGEKEEGREEEKEGGRGSREEHSLDVQNLGVNAKEMS